MTTEIFAGRACAQQRLRALAGVIETLKQRPQILTFYVIEDPGSVLYTSKKKSKAKEVGIDFIGYKFSFGDNPIKITELIKQQLALPPQAGVMIQKPTRQHYHNFFAQHHRVPPLTFAQWWSHLLACIPPERDLDGLTPQTQERLAQGRAVVCLPATVKAVLLALEQFDLSTKKILIIGISDLLGRPLAAYWRAKGLDVTLVGHQGWARLLAQKGHARDFGVIVSATGQPGIITGDLITDGVILVDVGEPKGDIDQESVRGKAAFLTPVPGGIGPMTIACLLENALTLSQLHGELEFITRSEFHRNG